MEPPCENAAPRPAGEPPNELIYNLKLIYNIFCRANLNLEIVLIFTFVDFSIVLSPYILIFLFCDPLNPSRMVFDEG